MPNEVQMHLDARVAAAVFIILFDCVLWQHKFPFCLRVNGGWHAFFTSCNLSCIAPVRLALFMKYSRFFAILSFVAMQNRVLVRAPPEPGRVHVEQRARRRFRGKHASSRCGHELK